MTLRCPLVAPREVVEKPNPVIRSGAKGVAGKTMLELYRPTSPEI